jgi:hypothetical protein
MRATKKQKAKQLNAKRRVQGNRVRNTVVTAAVAAGLAATSAAAQACSFVAGLFTGK